jgi:uncharacterized protein (DUF433 family)
VEKAYVEKRQEGFWIAGTRVSLGSVVRAFLDGWSPEAIAQESFPTLTREQVYGAVAYYLGNRDEVEAYLEQNNALHREEREAHDDPAFTRRMAQARQRFQSSRP